MQDEGTRDLFSLKEDEGTRDLFSLKAFQNKPQAGCFCMQGRIKGGGNGGNCPGPPAARGPPVMMKFVCFK